MHINKTNLTSNKILFISLLTIIFLFFLVNRHNHRSKETMMFWDDIYQGCLKTSPEEQCDCVFDNIKKNYKGKESQFIHDMENSGILDKEFARCYQELSAYSYQ
jgi:hypothetical protein